MYAIGGVRVSGWPVPRTAPRPARVNTPIDARPKLREALAELGIETISDLLETPPFRFDDFSAVTALASVAAGRDVTVLVTVESVSERRTSRRNLRIINAVVSDQHGGVATISWFNQRYLLRMLEPGMLLLVRGDVRSGRRLEIAARSHEIVATAAERDASTANQNVGLVGVYHASARVSSRVLRTLTTDALALLDAVGDPLPASLRAARRLPLRRDALLAAHRPLRLADADVGRRRLAYEELLLLQVALLRHRRSVDTTTRAVVLAAPGVISARYRAALPFVLTAAQERALVEIGRDLERPTPMQRLLQGDVGSGKTAVALGLLVRAVENDGQGALMAPTEVLAVQHHQTALRLLDPLGIEICLVTGDVPRREADARRQRIAGGEPLIAIGTHALLNAEFGALRVVVIDEQQRFGVQQRDALSGGRDTPHVLHMTATPIPRSLALTVFGDLDVTTLDEIPAGRKPVVTRIIPETKRADCYRWIVEQVSAGRQVYIVCPLVDGAAQVEARAAEQEAERLATGPLADVTVDCVHGQMKAAERGQRMRRFAGGETAVLVATTVIEVGVDVANASIMVIEDADRFGLSQLHQLRGRVGRGGDQAYCLLFESSEPTPDGHRRLQALTQHTSGFALAEIDLDLRGEGHVMGQVQSGRSELRHARLGRDRDLLEEARVDAAGLLDDHVLATASDERFGALIAGIRRG